MAVISSVTGVTLAAGASVRMIAALVTITAEVTGEVQENIKTREIRRKVQQITSRVIAVVLVMRLRGSGSFGRGTFKRTINNIRSNQVKVNRKNENGHFMSYWAGGQYLSIPH